MLAVSEIFGPTIQGEGPSSGRYAKFLRLMGCNLHCSWCDTKYTWDASNFNLKAETTKMSVPEVAEELNKIDCDLLVVTGGEPLLQAEALKELFMYCPPALEVEFETNGTVQPFVDYKRNVRYNVSPKLAHADDGRDPYEKRIIGSVIKNFVSRGDARFKFVAEHFRDFDEIIELTKKFNIPREDVWVMPQARSVEELDAALPIVAECAIVAGFNVSDRMHLRLWGGERGR